VVAPVKILLVDDQPSRLLTYRAILEPLGESLVEAQSGNEALQRLMDDEFAVILLDVNMPGMDGFETASMIHQHPRFEQTPIIFVTAVNVGDMDRLRGYKLGAVDYVSVPVIPEIMRTKVAVLIELYRKRRELQLANEQLAAANQSLRIEKARELEALNESLRVANAQLGYRNAELQGQVAEREIAQARLGELDRRKDEFLATLAHELRNPLAALRNALGIRRLAGVDDALQATMDRQLDLLVRLIDDLLDVARISRGKLALRPAATTLQDVLQAAIENSSALLDCGDHALRLDLPDAILPLRADPHRLAQVFSNLLSNAVKYSESATPIVLTARSDAGGITVDVLDQGVGLSADQASHIFELFAQVDTSIERSRGGLGIGLTLVRQLVEMHGGTVTVGSAGLGKGSCFRVWLPATIVADTPAAADPPKVAAPGPVQRRRALVLDDNRDAADTLAMMLELLGHDVQRLYDPHQAVAGVERFNPDIVFLDIGMPGISGYDVARALRETEHGATPVLVAVTGWGQPEDLRRTREAGFDHHLVKPPELDEIRRLCSNLAPRERPA